MPPILLQCVIEYEARTFVSPLKPGPPVFSRRRAVYAQQGTGLELP